MSDPKLLSGAQRLQPLSFFEGDWQIEGETNDASGKPVTFKAPYSISRDLGGAWLVGSASVMGNAVRDFWGYDPAAKDFVRIQLQSDGTRGEVHSAGWEGETLTWVGDAIAADGAKVKIRTRQTKAGPDSFHVTWEMRDASGWKIYSRETLKRINRR